VGGAAPGGAGDDGVGGAMSDGVRIPIT
jgi:hypothetical protein